ncbi:MAG TPA: TetR/AcrR family transcriptional regulator [Streptosporangiaceae bacterium]|jgi:AcrR family transcriptional regulator
MPAIRTARELARAELTSQIKCEARRQLAEQGAQRLSLRAVARELGMASSAIYRYFPSRDELLTAMIVDAYDALGDAVEGAAGAGPGTDARARWRACCHAVRSWALASPHEYALIYGSPVPGYRAPRQTVEPAGRVPVVIGSILSDAWPDGGSRPAAPGDGRRPAQDRAALAADHAGPLASSELPGQLAAQAAVIAGHIAPGVPGPVVARALVAWTQLFGMVSFELFGQLAGSADPADGFFAFAVEQMADYLGLPG